MNYRFRYLSVIYLALKQECFVLDWLRWVFFIEMFIFQSFQGDLLFRSMLKLATVKNILTEEYPFSENYWKNKIAVIEIYRRSNTG